MLHEVQIDSRRQRTRAVKFRTENLGKRRVFSDYRVTNPESGGRYTVSPMSRKQRNTPPRFLVSLLRPFRKASYEDSSDCVGGIGKSVERGKPGGRLKGPG